MALSPEAMPTTSEDVHPQGQALKSPSFVNVPGEKVQARPANPLPGAWSLDGVPAANPSLTVPCASGNPTRYEGLINRVDSKLSREFGEPGYGSDS